LDERLKEFYELRASEEPPSDPEAKLRFRKALDAAGLRAGESVLDLGAKWGGLAASIDVPVDYTGLDLSEVNAEAATKAGLTFVQGDVTQPLPFGDASFDRVFCLELLEHLIAPARLLAEIHRVLKADGRAIISVPSPYSWVEVAHELFGLHDTEGHLNAFTTPVMENLAGLTGFRIERRLGTSLRIPKTSRLISTNSILARSRMYVLRPSDDLVFAGRAIPR
jgi:SAM-dependent methyltransferase